MPEHFPETADIETASPEYAARFDSRAGRWMLSVQEQLVREALPPGDGLTVLDVGGGHGQLALPLAQSGYRVTVLGSDPNPPPRLQALMHDGRLKYIQGNVIDLPFNDRAFAVTMSVRLMAHCEQWPKLVAELCRTADQRVIVDYPTTQSLNALTGLLFGAKKKVERNTRPYTLFSHRQVREAFRSNGCTQTIRHNQFFWPMVLHRMLNRPGLSAALEGAARVTGLTALWGSPTLLECRKEPAS